MFDRILLVIGVAGALVSLSTLVHYEVLRMCNQRFEDLHRVPGRIKVVLATAAAFASHLVQIALFAVAYWWVDGTASGSLHGEVGNRVLAFAYFSAETYTSLGLGDVYPVGAMRLIAGLEALTGLLMIGWTTSFTYLEMRRYWMVPER